MIKFAIIATRRKAVKVFGPFHSFELAQEAEALIAANTEIVLISELAKGTKVHEWKYKE